MKTRIYLSIAAVVTVLAFTFSALAVSNTPAPTGKPEATIDLATEEGVKMVKGAWRYSDTRIIEVDFRAPGPDKQPTGAAGQDL